MLKKQMEIKKEKARLELQKAGTEHPQTNGQDEQTIQNRLAK